MNVFLNQILKKNLRTCQIEAYEAIIKHFSEDGADRSGLIQLPTGTGKSALIAITPFNLSVKKVLILTPNVKLAQQIEKDLDLTKGDNIYRKLKLLEEELLNNLEMYVLRLK